MSNEQQSATALKTAETRFAEPPPSSPAKLRIANLGMTFTRGGKTLEVLHDVSLDVTEGEFVCLLGPSGCGKSTLLNTMAGFLKPSTGEVTIDGEKVVGPDPRRIFVFQERGVFPWLTVEGNIEFGLFKESRVERRRRVAHYIGLVGLKGFEKVFPADLSGGMKQRLEVARALAVNPDMLFLDEPFGALDSMTRLTMRRELLHIWEAERKTILFVTHDLNEALQLADRIVIMSARPATIQHIVNVEMPHPRNVNSTHYLACRSGIAAEIGMTPDV